MVRSRVAAVTIAAIAVAALCAGLLLAAGWPDSGGDLVVACVVGLPTLVLGTVIAFRRPANPVGALLCACGAVPIVSGLQDQYGSIVARHPGALPVSDVLVSLSQGAWVSLYLPPAFLFLLFPDGRFLTPRWRRVGFGLLGVSAVLAVMAVGTPGDYPAPFENAPKALGSLPGWSVAVGVGFLAALLALLASAVCSVVVRYRRALSACGRFNPTSAGTVARARRRVLAGLVAVVLVRQR